jgi:hypothetical protein
MPKQRIVEIYAVHGDGGERSLGPIIGYCESQSDADRHKKGTGWYGGDGHVSKACAIEVNGSLYVLAAVKPIVFMDKIEEQKRLDQELRAKTIASLSEEQLRVLGLE